MIKTGSVLNGKYRIERLLGRGGSGSVYLCTNIELGNRWAVKHIPDERLSDKTMSEIEIMKKLYHPSLPRIADVFLDKQGLYIVESNIEGITLDSLLRQRRSLEMEEILDWSLELCDILGYLHGVKPKPIIYGDLKPANIMITQGNRLVLVDFGISREFCRYQSENNIIAGTSAYAAPEQLIKGGMTDQRTDIYNLGATMYQLLHGRLPESKDGGSQPCKDRVKFRFHKVIDKCMKNNPEDRYQRVEDIQQELQSVKNAFIVSKARQKTIFKLEVATVVILSMASYAVAVLGMIRMQLK